MSNSFRTKHEDYLVLYKANADGKLKVVEHYNVTGYLNACKPLWNIGMVKASINEGVVHNSALWLRERNDEQAKKAFKKYWTALAEEHTKAAIACAGKAANVEVAV